MKEEEEILNTWHLNAKAWIKTIAGNTIESRKLVTNQAIVNEVVALNPVTVIDLGCGEGWLIHALQSALPECHFTGLDAIPELTQAAAIKNTGAAFYTQSYQSIIEGNFYPSTKADVLVINFALFGNETVAELLTVIRRFISSGGYLLIQTLHPHSSNGDHPYAEGWRPGSWKGFSEDFTSPAPWYFRTMESWVSLFLSSGYNVDAIREPIHPVTKVPVSVIFKLSLKEN